MLNSFRPTITNITNYISKRSFKTTPHLTTFWERDDKGGYKDKRKPPTLNEKMRDGIKGLKQEVKLWMKEVKEDFASDPYMIYRPNETDVVWDFSNEETLKKWLVTSDSDHGEGYSKCSLTVTNSGKGLFSGELSTRVPKDGRVKRSGYCNMRTIRHRKSFQREAYLQWTPYNMLVMRVRGDGRSYLLNISTRGYYDLLWNDVFNFVLYTRGGPYWQVAKIPLSKFFLSSKGRVQDRQTAIRLDKVSSFGISVGDKINGSFSLEIDYIGLENDPTHTEEFAYEMYQLPYKYMAAN